MRRLVFYLGKCDWDSHTFASLESRIWQPKDRRGWKILKSSPAAWAGFFQYAWGEEEELGWLRFGWLAKNISFLRLTIKGPLTPVRQVFSSVRRRRAFNGWKARGFSDIRKRATFRGKVWRSDVFRSLKLAFDERFQIFYRTRYAGQFMQYNATGQQIFGK